MEHNMDEEDALAALDFELTGEESGEEVDLTQLWLRRIAWDVIPCADAPSVQASLGLVPSDPEAAENEHRASHARMALASPLEPAIDQFAGAVSQVLSRYLVDMFGTQVKESITPELMDKLVRQNTEIVRVGSMAVLAQLIDTGVLGYTEKILGRFAEQQGDDV
jgi:hypothetical protein